MEASVSVCTSFWKGTTSHSIKYLSISLPPLKEGGEKFTLILSLAGEERNTSSGDVGACGKGAIAAGVARRAGPYPMLFEAAIRT